MPVHCAPEDLTVLFLYDIDPDWEAADRISAIESNGKMAEALKQAGHPVIPVEVNRSDLDSLLSGHSADELIVFNQCESIPGVPHSEHEAARIIESQGFTYTGSTPDVLKLAGNKIKTKELLDSMNVPTPGWRVYHEPSVGDWDLFPAIVKTSYEHCSISLNPESVVMNTRELESRVEYILENFNQPAMVEDFIDGREFHIPLCGNGKLRMLPPVEMDFSAFNDIHDRLCTYDSKFDPGSMHYKKIESRIPAPLGNTALKRLEKICIQAFRAIGCRDYARMDVRERDGRFYVLDVNPNADLAIDASIACSAEYSGMSYPEMMAYLVSLAARRHARYSGRTGEIIAACR
jgi:D-alanine-D-alanine ligase